MFANFPHVVPANAGTHNHQRLLFGETVEQGHSHFPHHQRRRLWVPAFAGTTSEGAFAGR
jgi:hypothetical protein